MTRDSIEEIRRLYDAGYEKIYKEIPGLLDVIERYQEALELIAEHCHGDMANQAQWYAKNTLAGLDPQGNKV